MIVAYKKGNNKMIRLQEVSYYTHIPGSKTLLITRRVKGIVRSVEDKVLIHFVNAEADTGYYVAMDMDTARSIRDQLMEVINDSD